MGLATIVWPAPHGPEWALACDRGRPRRLLIVPALFDEASRMRRFCADVMRRLDAAGIDSLMPEVPGWGESRADPLAQTVAGWRAAMAAAAVAFGAGAVLAVRGGALIAPDLPGRALAPAEGAALLRPLLRAEILSAREAGRNDTAETLLARGTTEPLNLTGHLLAPALLAGLRTATPRALPAIDLGGAPLWRRAEPDHDPAQAEALAALIAPGVPTGPVPPRFAAPDLATRRALTIPCAADTLAATLDLPATPPRAALLWVTGGREIRAGHAATQARMAARLAAQGIAVLRHDRRGVGDSSGEAVPFADTRADIAAALGAMRAACPGVPLAAYGNCDAASALMLQAAALTADALILANPWTFDSEDAPPPPQALRAHYRQRFASLSAIRRVLTGQVNLLSAARSLLAASRRTPRTTLADEMAAGLAAFSGPVRILIAGRDRTGQTFRAGWEGTVHVHPDAGHIFAEAPDWWIDQVLKAVEEKG